MREAYAKLKRALRWLEWTLQLVFAAWMGVYMMPISAGFLAIHSWLGRPWSPAGRGLRAFSLAVGLVLIPLVGLPEYVETTNHLHCRALGFQGAEAPADCTLPDLERGRVLAREGGPLFTPREQLGIHGFNHLLAFGGLLAGFPEVAYETAKMSWVADPVEGGATQAKARDRVRQCSERAALGELVVLDSEMPMRSSAVRQLLAKAVGRLPERAGAERELGEVHFAGSTGRNNSAYLHALRTASLRAALALEVNDSRLRITRREDGRVDAAWAGTIVYPPGHFAFEALIPTLAGPRTLRVSETLFCGMQIDGVMNPYPLELRWVLDPEDPRLRAPLVDESERFWLEWLAWKAATEL